jgi:hypothetical protein
MLRQIHFFHETLKFISKKREIQHIYLFKLIE